MQKTPIEYLSYSWNPLAMRCTRVSAGCKNCWHLRMAKRLAGNDSFFKDAQAAYHGGQPVIRQNELSAPLRRKKPAIIGTQFMGDLFHESITNEQIAAVFGVMAACPQHTFCVLTKRVERAVKWYEWIDRFQKAWMLCRANMILQIDPPSDHFDAMTETPWPLPNVWLGVSVEDQETYDERWNKLKQIPAALRSISYEPALGPICMIGDLPDWVICGAETGPGKRPMDPEWAYDLLDQCKAANVPYFFKKDSNGDNLLYGMSWEEMPNA